MNIDKAARIISILLVVGCTLITGIIIGFCSRPVFRNGEGEVIPDHAVNLLVQSEFVLLDLPEVDTLQKYFPYHNQ